MPKIIEVPGFGQVEFPDNMDDNAITAAIQKNMIPAKDNGEAGRRAGAGVTEAAMSLATGIPAFLGSGIAGVASLPWGLDTAANNVHKVQEALTYQPRSKEGKEAVDWVGGKFKEGADALGSVGPQVLSTIPLVGDRIVKDVTSDENKHQFTKDLMGEIAINVLSLEAMGGVGMGTFRGGKAVYNKLRGKKPEAAPTSEIAASFERAKNPVIDFKEEAGGRAFDQMRQDLDPSAPTPAAMNAESGHLPYADMGANPDAVMPQMMDQLGHQQKTDAQAQAQAAIEARQRALEEQVARQGGLDRNAAERARQENAPTGYQQWAENQMMDDVNQSTARTQDLNQRGQQMNIVEDFGNNDPMSRMPNMRVDENGMPIRADLSMDAQNVQNPLQRNLWGDEMATRTGDGGIPLTQAMDRMAPEARAQAIRDNFMGNKERGAIDVDAVKDAFMKMRMGHINDHEYLKSFDGTFNGKPWHDLLDDLYSPKSRSTVMLMSPDTFLSLADKRDYHHMQNIAPESHKNVKEGLASKEGLHSIPFLQTEYKNGILQVTGHEGRHRMDIFRDNGINLVPVRVMDSMIRWGEDSVPAKMRAQDGSTTINTPENLSVKYDASGKRTNGIPRDSMNTGMARGQRGAVDVEFIVPRVLLKKFDGFMKAKGATTWGNIHALVEDTNYILTDNQKRELASKFPDDVAKFDQRIEQANRQGNEAKAARYEERKWDSLLASALFERGDKNPFGATYPGGEKKNLGSALSELKEVTNRLREQSQPKSNVVPLNTGMARGQKGAVQFPDSPENARKKQEINGKLRAIGEVLPEWTDVTTSTEAIELGKAAKDINQTAAGRQVSSGLNQVTAYHNNPVLKYARYQFQKARNWTNEQIRTYVTNKENGIGQAIQKLTKDEQVRVNEILQLRDKHQIDIPEDIKAKMSPAEKAFFEAHDKVMDAMWDAHVKTEALHGRDPGKKRYGYTPNILTGDYKSVVLDKDGSPIGFIGVDTPGEFMKAMEYYKKKHPEAKFSADTWQKARKQMRGNQNKGFVYQDLQQALNLLAEADPNFAKVVNTINEAVSESARTLYNFDVHNKFKKGIEGNQGNKAWLSPEKNARARLDSLVKYIEEGFEYHSLQEPIVELNNLQKHSDLQHLENTFSYLGDYLANAKGAYQHWGGQAFNTVFDALHKYMLETPASVIPVAKNYVGPSNTLKTGNVIRHKMSQWFMGMGNMPFTAAQLMQPLQTGVPLMELVRQRVGIDNPAVVATSMNRGAVGATRAFMKELGLDVEVPAHMQEAWDHGRKTGMFNFSEMEKAYEGHKSKAGRTFDKYAEMNMVVGESATRPMMFLSFVDMLHEAGYSVKDAIPTAEHLTQTAMIDYHRYERPLLYSGMGVLGQHAGGLTTFKHGFMGQQALLAKEIGKQKTVSSAMPALYSAGLSVALLAGLTGLPFYGEMDTLFKEIMHKATGKSQSIAQTFLQNVPEWAKTGALSSILGMNMQGKFSSENMIPDTVGKAVAPHLTGAAQMASGLADGLQGDREGLANAAMAASPNSTDRAVEAAVRRDDKGFVLDKHQQRLFDLPRSDEDWWKAGVSGLTPLNEANQRRDNFDSFQARQSKLDSQKNVSEQFARAVRNDRPQAELAELLKEYVRLQGDPRTLIKRMGKVKTEQQWSELLRMSGIPDTGSYSETQRYMDFHRK